MNERDTQIADQLLARIAEMKEGRLCDDVSCYRAFLECVQMRQMVENPPVASDVLATGILPRQGGD